MDTGTQVPPLGGLIWPILWAIVSYSRRKEEIGGWLFFYYGQLYLGSVLTVLLLLANFQPADPLYLFTIVPLSAIIIAQTVVAHRLRRTRDPAYLIPLRRILWAHLVFAIIKIAIDSKYSPIATILDGIGVRSEEHTSELQSLAYLVCRLLLEKKKITHPDYHN